MITVDSILTLEETHCAACGVHFALPDHMLKAKRETGANFYCPNGHCLVFKSENERLKREKAEIQEKFFAEQRKSEALQREKERIEKRISKGVCPCCKRHFVNVSRHMKTKHPAYSVNVEAK